MFTIGEYFFYNDPVKIIWRKGTPEDPYVDKIDNLIIVDNRTVLSEIPDEFHRVVIDGYTELIQDKFDSPRRPLENEFIVNYQNGIITFHESKNTEVIVAEYKGKGIIQYPAERIYVHTPNPYAVENLQQFIELLIQKGIEIDEVLQEAYEATLYANEAGDYANEQGLYAKRQGDRINYSIDMNKIVQIETERAKDFAIDAGEQALDARDKAIDARNRTILIWQSPVDDYDDLLSTYPHPEVGWTVLLNNSGVVYRFDGANWLEIGNMTLSTPLANENVDGLMSRNGFVKLRDIEEEAQVNYTGEDAKDVLPDYFKTKVICFVIPDTLEIGIQNIIINFPYDGEIVDIKASLGIEGTDSTKIDIEKISEQDFKDKEDWESVLEDKIFIDYGERVDDKSFIISEIEVNKNDYFRVNILEAGIGASNLTILIEIKI